jgi:GTP pyrophosphokinase/guanosine-3',5'-bis(diphosphate) 3'-pyrophosphohydrolase
VRIFSKAKQTKTIESAKELLFSQVEDGGVFEEALEYCIESHEGQFRKSGEPYAVHPILVSAIVASYGGDESMIKTALLHDVVEDTDVTIEQVTETFGQDVANLVEGLTKIVEIRDEKLPPSSRDTRLVSAALTFRKMLVASIVDIRVLFIKLCDRVHNMLTLDALQPNKQKRIAEETLVVYAPIAHRLGIETIKNELENLSFYYIFPEEFERIEKHLIKSRQKLQLKLNELIMGMNNLLLSNGFKEEKFSISSRVKRPYSIYLKMQRKGVSIEEILDLLALRIIVEDPLECYKVLGLIHLNYKPIISRFKDYITIPKENGYQTIHTTVFDDSFIFEIQIRTKDMHKTAEYGLAAHWKYKTGAKGPKLDWLGQLQFKDENAEEFYNLVKNDLYSDDVAIFSPQGDVYSLPQGAVALDFAYAIHSEIGNKAVSASINRVKSSLLTVLKSGDIVKIETEDEIVPRCSWLDMVKTSKAKQHIRHNCGLRVKEIDRKNVINIISTIFSKPCEEIDSIIKEFNFDGSIHKAGKDVNFLKEIKNRLRNHYRANSGILGRIKIKILKLREQRFDDILIYSNYNIKDISFDYCCHPKRGDEMLAFKAGSGVVVHHKLCDKAYEQLEGCSKMIYAKWAEDEQSRYKAVVYIDNKKGALAGFLEHLADRDINILSVEIGSKIDKNSGYCEVIMDTKIKDIKQIQNLISPKFKLIELISADDAFNAQTF